MRKCRSATRSSTVRPRRFLQFSHLTTLSSQSVRVPVKRTLPYLYNQRDLLGDDWLELDHQFRDGLLSFKYDVGTETLATNYVQGQVAQAQPTANRSARRRSQSTPTRLRRSDLSLAQTQRSAVLRYNGDPTSQIHYSLAALRQRFQHVRLQLRSARRPCLDADRKHGGARVGRHDVSDAATLRARRSAAERSRAGRRHHLHRQSEPAPGSRNGLRSRRRADLRATAPSASLSRSISIRRICARRRAQLNVTPIPNCQTKQQSARRARSAIRSTPATASIAASTARRPAARARRAPSRRLGRG